MLPRAVPIPLRTNCNRSSSTIDAILDPLCGRAKNEVKPSVWYAKQAKDKDAVAAATDRLQNVRAQARAPDLAKLSPLQLVMMDDFAQYQADLDDSLKWTNVPAWQVPPDLGKKTGPGPFSELLPAYLKVTQAKLRSQQIIAAHRRR